MMKSIAAEIYDQQSLVSVEGKIVPVKEIFRLQDMAELKQAEDLYLPQHQTGRQPQTETGITKLAPREITKTDVKQTEGKLGS
jgi:hypothetical protein